MTRYRIIEAGVSRSFPEGDPFLEAASKEGEITVYLGVDATWAYRSDPSKVAVLVELGTEYLGMATGEKAGHEGSNAVGFARFHLGNGDPSKLIEMVVQPNTDPKALEAARAVFEDAGLEVAICRDFAGRILDRLIRPFYNEALNKLDEGLATAEDMDLTVKLGLGYPEGPIELLERTGLAHHHDVSQALFEVYGTRHYAPARRAKVAKRRSETGA